MRDKLSRSAAEQSASLAAANAPILRHAARALIRNCDTLQLMGVGAGGAETSSSGSSIGGASGAPGGALAPAEAAATAEEAAEPVQPAQAAGEGAEAVAAADQGPRTAGASSCGGGSARIAALLCFDEMQVGAGDCQSVGPWTHHLKDLQLTGGRRWLCTAIAQLRCSDYRMASRPDRPPAALALADGAQRSGQPSQAPLPLSQLSEGW